MWLKVRVRLMVGRELVRKFRCHDGRLSLKRIQILSSSRNALVSELAYASQPARRIRTIARAGVSVKRPVMMRERVAFIRPRSTCNGPSMGVQWALGS